MAQRRMFSLKIIDTDGFLDMPISARELYFQFGMRADDDGFVGNPKRIMKMIGASDDDIKVLIAKKFIIPFESGVCVISDWKIHNYIQTDRYQETQFKLEKKALIENESGKYLLGGSIPKCIQYVYTGKDRLGKDNNAVCEQTASLEENKGGDTTDSGIDINKRGNATVENATDIEVVECDEDGNEIVKKKSKVSRNKTAFALQKYFVGKCIKEIGKVPEYNSAGYVMLVKLLKSYKEQSIRDIMDDWFNESKKDEDLIQITQCLSANHVNRWKVNN